jgi:diphthine-ammonia ligase
LIILIFPALWTVCLANLEPENSNDDEINSFMYQSAAHAVIPLQAQCFSKPLFRRFIKGVAKVTSMAYSSTTSSEETDPNYDEVEDLFYLLNEIKEYYNGDIQGVSCGAIASNYQRIRVEDVCARLNMIPLTYLWQRNRMTLLNEMISDEYNLHAILVKVAGAGLDPAKHLNKDLKELQPTLLKLNQKYGLDMCGEGNNYVSVYNYYLKYNVLLQYHR